jgi:GlpG protein
VFSRLGADGSFLQPLFITGFDPAGPLPHGWGGLSEIRSGELWRFLTPIFIHFGPFHLFFNMLWLLDLGSMIEARQSTVRLATLVVAIGVTSNLAEYLNTGPAFGGMSGVVYGLLGYTWVKSRMDPGSGLFLHPYTVAMMLVWFFLCWFKVIPNVANTVHGVGLVLGMASGFLTSLHRLRASMK